MTPTRDNTASIPEASLFSDVRSLEKSGLKVAERRYEPGDTVFMAGDPADRLYLLAEGMVRVCKPYGSYSQATIGRHCMKTGRVYVKLVVSDALSRASCG